LYLLALKVLKAHPQSRRGPCLGSDSHLINFHRQLIHPNLSALKDTHNAFLMVLATTFVIIVS